MIAQIKELETSWDISTIILISRLLFSRHSFWYRYRFGIDNMSDTGTILIPAPFLTWIPISDMDTDFWHWYRFLTWIPISDIYTDLWHGYQFLTWIPIYDIDTDLWHGYRFLTWKPISDMYTDFWHWYRYLTWIPISDMDTDIWHGSRFLTIIPISDMDTDFWHGYQFLTWILISGMDTDFWHGYRFPTLVPISGISIFLLLLLHFHPSSYHPHSRLPPLSHFLTPSFFSFFPSSSSSPVPYPPLYLPPPPLSRPTILLSPSLSSLPLTSSFFSHPLSLSLTVLIVFLFPLLPSSFSPFSSSSPLVFILFLLPPLKPSLLRVLPLLFLLPSSIAQLYNWIAATEKIKMFQIEVSDNCGVSWVEINRQSSIDTSGVPSDDIFLSCSRWHILPFSLPRDSSTRWRQICISD